MLLGHTSNTCQLSTRRPPIQLQRLRMATGRNSHTYPAPSGRIARIPGTVSALACFFRRNKTSGEEKGCRNGLSRSQKATTKFPSFLKGGWTWSNAKEKRSRASKAQPEYRYSKATSCPSGLFVSSAADSSAAPAREEAPGALNGEGVRGAALKAQKNQTVAPVPPLCCPDGDTHCWPFSDNTYLVSTIADNNAGCLAVSGVSFQDLSSPKPHHALKPNIFDDGRKGEPNMSRGAGAEIGAKPSTLKAPSACVYRSSKSEEQKSCICVRELQSSLQDPRPAKTGEEKSTDGHEPQRTAEHQHLEDHCAGFRRAAAAGRLSSREERPSQEKKRLFLNGGHSSALLAQLGVTVSCRKGLKRVTSNQDDFFAYSCDSWGLYGVFDGHGRGGHMVANFVQWHLPTLIYDFMCQTENLQAALRFAFNKVNSLLKEASAAQRFDSAASGSTASVVLHMRQEKKLYVAYVGDSTVVLARRNNQGQLVAHTVTKDHRPEDPTERSRIESVGGEIRRPVGHVPYRVFVKGKDYPGLAMSRSLGDYMSHCAGVTMEPDILELEVVEGRDELVVMCTDGIWEFISPREAVEIFSRYSFHQAAEAVRALSSEAWKRWLKEDDACVDDITVQLIHLFPPILRTDKAERSKSSNREKIRIAF